MGVDPFARAVDLTLSGTQSEFPVLELASSRLVGQLIEVELVSDLRAHGADTPVRQVMRAEIAMATTEEPLVMAQQRMTQRGLQALPCSTGMGVRRTPHHPRH